MRTTNLLAGRIAGADGPWTAIEASGSRFLTSPASGAAGGTIGGTPGDAVSICLRPEAIRLAETEPAPAGWATLSARVARVEFLGPVTRIDLRSEEHTSELQSLMRISYAVFCLKKTKKTRKIQKR